MTSSPLKNRVVFILSAVSKAATFPVICVNKITDECEEKAEDEGEAERNDEKTISEGLQYKMS